MTDAGGPRSRCAQRIPLLFLAAVVAVLPACAFRGPEAVGVQRLGYNTSLQVSEAEELLLNLVRLRYQDSPEFLSVSAISSQLNYRASASLGGDFGNVEDSTSAFIAPNLGGELSESPTVTLVPRRDEEFSRQLLSPIPIDSITLLAFSNWGVDRLMLLFAESVNGIEGRNTFARAGARGDEEAFLALLRSLRVGEEAGAIRFYTERRRRSVLDLKINPANALETLSAARRTGYNVEVGIDTVSLYDDASVVVLRMDDAFLRTDAYKVLVSVLGLTPGENTVDLVRSTASADVSDGRIHIRPRSPAAVLSLLATAVEIPSAHAQTFGLADNAEAPDPIRRLLRVRVAAERPENAWLAVPYRGHYFYLENGDVSSRQTLYIASAFMNLSLTRGDTGSIPVVTLPVGR